MTDRDRAEPPQSDIVRAALAGDLPLAALTATERLTTNLELDRRIQLRASAASFGELLASEGRTIVVLGEDGRLVERAPDGDALRQFRTRSLNRLLPFRGCCLGGLRSRFSWDWSSWPAAPMLPEDPLLVRRSRPLLRHLPLRRR